MMNVSEPVKQEMAEAFAFVAKQTNKELCLGDVIIDDEGVAFSHVVKDGKFDKLVLTGEVQATFMDRAKADMDLVTSAMKALAEVVKEEPKTQEEKIKESVAEFLAD